MFNEVVVKINPRSQPGNLHIAVHPFKCSRLYMMMWVGDYGDRGFENEGLMSEYQKKLADQLWEKIPGMHTMFFMNGEITIQHNELFGEDDIFEAVKAIVKPILEQNLLLMDTL